MALTGSSRDPKSMIFRFLIQELFTNVTQISRFLFRHGNPLERVEFTFKTKNPAIFRAAFNCPTQFGASENRLIFSRQALHVALETADAFALKTLEQALNGLMEQERRQQDQNAEADKEGRTCRSASLRRRLGSMIHAVCVAM